MSSDLQLELSDFDAAVDDLRAAGSDADKARRAIRAALDHLYSLQAQLESTHADYWTKVENDSDGQVCAGLTFIRGRAVHRLVRAHQYAILVPSEHLAPSKDLFPGFNWQWMEWSALDPLLPADGKGNQLQRDNDRRRYVKAQVEDRIVLQTLHEARALIVSLV